MVASLKNLIAPGRYHDEEVMVENGLRTIGTGLGTRRLRHLSIEPETAGVASFGQTAPVTMQLSFDREE